MSAITQGSAEGLSYLAHEGGAGTPIVLLHGIGSNAQSFASFMQALEGRPILAWDAPGYGTSQPLAAEWPDASDYAAALNRLLVRLDMADQQDIASAAFARRADRGALCAGGAPALDGAVSGFAGARP